MLKPSLLNLESNLKENLDDIKQQLKNLKEDSQFVTSITSETNPVKSTYRNYAKINDIQALSPINEPSKIKTKKKEDITYISNKNTLGYSKGDNNYEYTSLNKRKSSDLKEICNQLQSKMLLREELLKKQYNEANSNSKFKQSISEKNELSDYLY